MPGVRTGILGAAELGIQEARTGRRMLHVLVQLEMPAEGGKGKRMYIYYDHSTVTGFSQDEDRKNVTEDFVHRRGQDPLQLAARRNNQMAQMSRYTVTTEPAFHRWVDEEPTIHRADIPRMKIPEYEY